MKKLSLSILCGLMLISGTKLHGDDKSFLGRIKDMDFNKIKKISR